MNWISSLKKPGHITDAISHFNEAIDRLEDGKPKVEVSGLLFDALNKIQTEWQIHEEYQKEREAKAFQTMISKGLQPESRAELLISSEMRNFVFFEPQIRNHDTLKRHNHRPDVEMGADLFKKATKEHHKLAIAYKDYLPGMTEENEERTLKRAAKLLYIVRSNMKHGEKTPYGPDLKKKERDEKVCEVVIPLQILIFDFLLDFRYWNFNFYTIAFI